MTPKNLHDFAGRWRLGRLIDDSRAGHSAHATGQAVLTPDAAGLVYDEEILLHLPGQAPIEGRRRYLWRTAPGGIAVLFADGRDFHTFTLDGARPVAAHWCDPDRYDVSYDLGDWPRWSTRWEVRGPHKDYVMQTTYMPQDGPDAMVETA